MTENNVEKLEYRLEEKIANKFLDVLKNSNPKTYIYYQFFSGFLRKIDVFHMLLNVHNDYIEYKKNPDDSHWWFISFHKSIRQTDFFGSYYTFEKTHYENKLTEEEKIRYSELDKKISKSDDSCDIGDDLIKEFKILKRKKNYLEIENISGYLDSLLWETISNGNGELLDAFVLFFENTISVNDNNFFIDYRTTKK